MQFRRIGQLVAATTVSAVALSGAQAVAQENKTTISVTNITLLGTNPVCIYNPLLNAY